MCGVPVNNQEAWMFTTIFPIITTPDLAGALAFYRIFSGRR